MRRDEDATWDSSRFARQLRALGEQVRAARQSHGWSQQDLSNRTEIHRANISRIERGKNFTLEVLWRLASTLEVHWADLLDDRATSVPEAPHASAPFEQQLHDFGTRVYQARVLQRLSQQALADRIGIGPSTIYWIEDGTRNVTLETLSRLAAGLRVHWADLLDDRHATPAQHADRPREDDPVGGTADHGERDHSLSELANAIDRRDRPRLATLSVGQLHRHLFARRLLANYLDQMWTDAQLQDLNPTQQPDWTGLAALRDLTHYLLATARNELLRRS